PAAPAGCPRPLRRAAGRRWKYAGRPAFPSVAWPGFPCRSPVGRVALVASIDSLDECSVGARGARLPTSLAARDAPHQGPAAYRIRPASHRKMSRPQELSMARAKSAGTLLYAQSGGVTAVINATASGVISEARARGVKVLAARNGILGALDRKSTRLNSSHV